jgi:CRP-like cAMP-binding protein
MSSPSPIVAAPVNVPLINGGLDDGVSTSPPATGPGALGDELVLFQLRSVALFGACSDEQLRTVAAMSGERCHAVGDEIARAGSMVLEVPILLDGYAGASVDGCSAVVVGPGAVIGGPEALDGALHPMTVVAQTPVVTRVIAAPDFDAVVAGVPPLATALIRQLGGRMRTVLHELACARQGSVAPRVGSTSAGRHRAPNHETAPGRR